MTTSSSELPIQVIPRDLECSICLEVPNRPLITPCEHIFCDTCLHRSFSVSIPNRLCPNCRTYCAPGEEGPLQPKTLLYRIWEEIQVKSKNDECISVERMNRENKDLRNKNEVLRNKNGVLNQQKEDFDLSKIRSKYLDLQSKNRELLESMKRRLEDVQNKNNQEINELRFENSNLRSKEREVMANNDHLVQENKAFHLKNEETAMDNHHLNMINTHLVRKKAELEEDLCTKNTLANKIIGLLFLVVLGLCTLSTITENGHSSFLELDEGRVSDNLNENETLKSQHCSYALE